MNTQRERALKLLTDLTPMTVQKRTLRSALFLSTAQKSIDYALRPEKWEDWCTGWAFAVRPEFADALDIKLTERVVKKKKTLVWTQGSVFDFHAGYTIYDIVQYPQEIWRDFLQRVSCAVTVVDARPIEPARSPSKLGPGISRDRGSITFQVFKPNNERTQLLLTSTQTVTHDTFITILITGLPNIEPDEEGNYMTSVHLTNTLKCYDAIFRPIEFCGTKFCLTGEFALGSREAVEKEIIKRGGTCLQHPLASGCILVVGTVTSDGWAYGDYGTKIKNAMHYRENANPVCIINEDFFVAELMRNDELNLPLNVKPICPQKPNVDILAGLAGGMIADGTIVQEEADFLLQWLQKNVSLHNVFPISVLLPRIEQFLSDGLLDKEEARELFKMLKVISENI